MIREIWEKPAARVLIGMVSFFNVQCALAFLFRPASYSAGFELDGDVGAMVVQAMGILFLMWNVPYVAALIDPIKYRTSLIEAVIMQSVGLIGESLLLATISPSHAIIQETMLRFILFDGTGLLALCMAILILKKHKNDRSPIL